MTRRATLVASAAVSVVLALPGAASAALGGDASSVEADRVHMQGALLRIARTDPYAVHEMQSSSGTTVREYVADGRVFAVAWQGPWMPDLRQVLGAYYDRYQEEARANRRRRGRSPLAVRTSDLVVETSGHPRAFAGRAYLPRLVPSGVSADAIR